MNNRQKGLGYCREVKKLLEGMNHVVEGPGYAVAFFNNRMSPIHRDYFSIYDLISFDGNHFIFHQVSTVAHKSEKIKAIQKQGMSGWVWCRLHQKIGYRIFFVSPDKIEEGEAVFKQ